MGEPLLRQRVENALDAALARARLTRALSRSGLTPRQRLAFVSDIARGARTVVEADRPSTLTVRLSADLRRLSATLETGSGGPHLWETVIEVQGAIRFEPGPELPAPDLLAEALLDGDEDAAVLLRAFEEEEASVEWHRGELERTNQGVLALHAELDAANDAQRRLLEAEQRARAETEAARSRLMFLSSASARLIASLNHREVLQCLVDLLTPAHADTARVWWTDEHRRLVPLTPSTGSAPDIAVLAVRTERPQHQAPHGVDLKGVDEVVSQEPSARLAVPLISQGSVLGVILLTARAERFEPDHAVMLTELVSRAAMALDNAQRFEKEKDTAETLQRAMLTRLPETPGLGLTARYLPAVSGMNVGGDWYDVFPQGDGSYIGVIGDVTGHGIQAAVMMGQLRNALRAYAVEGYGPGQLLTRLHTLLGHLEHDLFATATIVRLTPGDSVVTWASAGHPPPLLRTADGGVQVLDAGSGAMLGIPVEQSITEHRTALPSGCSLLLYTDGLVERREHGIDPGIEQLAAALGELPDVAGDISLAADALLEAMLQDHPGEDDVCLLLFHVLEEAERTGHRGGPAEHAPGSARC